MPGTCRCAYFHGCIACCVPFLPSSEHVLQVELPLFLAGFHEVVPPVCLADCGVGAVMLRRLLVGKAGAIDVAEWERHTEVGPDLQDAHGAELVHWFWQTLRDFDQDGRAKVLQFVTGSRVVSAGGFKAFPTPQANACPIQSLLPMSAAASGSIGLPSVAHRCLLCGRVQGMALPFKLDLQRDPTQLPTASTCFHQLRLPNVPTEAELRTKLLIALDLGLTGFGLA